MASEFEGAGSKPGLEVWRIEKMVPTKVPSKMIGNFYDGDAYIVCKTVQRQSSSSLSIDIFFWLGENCSKDEQGVAAYKTVELDEYLGGSPVQHREIMGHESDQFMQLFTKVEYLNGGVASGFKHVERDSHEPRLLHVKGSRAVRVSTKPMKAASLNSGDVFILDLGKKLIQWNGAEANHKEKAKALDVCVGIKDDERMGKCSIDACDQGAEPDEFWSALGGKGPVAAPIDDSVETASRGAAKLIKVSDATGAVATAEIANSSGATPLVKELLDTKDVFIMDNEAEIFVWIGKMASTDERKAGMQIGADYCAQAGRPKSTRVIKVMEGTEPTTFKSNFATWHAAPPSVVDFSSTPRGNVASGGETARSGTDLVADLESMRLRRESSALADAGDGTIVVYRIEGFETVEIDPSLHGKFYAGDSYIVKYTYEKDGRPMTILYFWLGQSSSVDEKGAAALHTKTMDDELGGAATQVRVVMGKEPLHFIRCFHGKMVVHSGGKAAGFKNREDADEYDKDGVALFHVRGSDMAHTRAVQVEEKAASLNSGDCFVLQTPSTIYVWMGGGANDAEMTTAKTVAGTMIGSRSLEEVAEGGEPDSFWAALGGKGEYPSTKFLDETSREPMLFSCSNATGTLQLAPVFDFSQDDLVEEDVYLLDSFTTIFVWIGGASNEQEKAGAKEAAAAYITKNGYSADTAVVTVKSGSEPAIFTCHFLGWNATKKARFVDPYEAKLAKLKAANPTEEEPVAVSDPAPPPPKPAAVPALPVGGTYTLNYDELKKPADQLPAGLDPTKKEQYLSDADFEKVLGSPRGVFAAMKPWKQAQIKKAAGLF